MNFIEELLWRGMIHDVTPGMEEELAKGIVTAYIGFDPTAPSLTVGNLATAMLLLHFQRAGHRPLVLAGGATGRIGDPSGKQTERKLIPVEELLYNQEKMTRQLKKFLDFDCGKISAGLVNNYDWFSKINPLYFFREAGKYLTVNYLLGKGFIKERLQNEDITFSEFNYILMQAYDFLWLYEHQGCTLQMGGSDQWGNITAGIELIRKKKRGKVFGLTCPLLTKADGTKFGKTEEGSIWLDPQLTSPYRFYQFWLNASDQDAMRYIRIFTCLPQKELEELEREHAGAPEKRLIQKKLAKDVTIRVHSDIACQAAINASEILFGDATTDVLRKLTEAELLDVFSGVPQTKVMRSALENGIPILEFLYGATCFLSSRGEARRTIKGGGIRINKERVEHEDRSINSADLLNGRYILIQKGKKNFCLVKVEE